MLSDFLRTLLTEMMYCVIIAFVSYLFWLARDLWARYAFNTALGRAAGLVLAHPAMQRLGAAGLDAALAVGVAYMSNRLPGKLRQLGVSLDGLPEVVRAEVGKQMAATVSAVPAQVVIAAEAAVSSAADAAKEAIPESLVSLAAETFAGRSAVSSRGVGLGGL